MILIGAALKLLQGLYRGAHKSRRSKGRGGGRVGVEGRKYNDLPIVHLFGFSVERHRSLPLFYCESKSLEILSADGSLERSPV